jgi:hypothetical protein
VITPNPAPQQRPKWGLSVTDTLHVDLGQTSETLVRQRQPGRRQDVE